MTGISKEHLAELCKAKALLESSSFAQQLTDTIGQPLNFAFEKLPPEYAEKINDIIKATLEKLLEVALLTTDLTASTPPSTFKDKLVVAGAGGLGGAFGFPVLAVELPFSTTYMLRSIAQIAINEGEDLTKADARLACLAVFAFTGKQKEEKDDVGSTYYATRLGLAIAVQEAAQFAARSGIKNIFARGTPPVLVQLITRIATRFGVTVSQKVMAQLIPLVGLIGGAAINTIFMDHFQNMAQGHFIVRRLERIYGEDAVKQAYLNIELSPNIHEIENTA